MLLKPNLVEFERDRVINTHPAVIAGAAQALLRAGARRVVVAEGPGHRRDIDYLVTGTGLLDYAKDVGVPFVDLNHDDVRRVPLASGFMALSDLALPAELLDADLVVSMPKLKTHHWMGMTCSLKNLFGVVPGCSLRMAQEHPALPRHRELDPRSRRHGPTGPVDCRRGGWHGR